jgi:thiol-disulfide isomerase/thioredoxin
MKRTKKLAFAFICSLLMVSVCTAKSGIQFQDMDLNEAILKAHKEKKMVFVDVYATWCGPCKYLSNSVFTNTKLEPFFAKNFISIKIDGEKGDGPDIMHSYNLDSYPTMLIFNAESKLVTKIVGAQGVDVILKKAKDARFPEQSERGKLNAKYKAGDNSKATMGALLEIMLEEEADAEEIDQMVKAYRTQHPKLNLKDKNDFIAFTLGTNDLNDPYVKTFLTNGQKADHGYPEVATTKIAMLLEHVIKDAIKEKDAGKIKVGITAVFPAYHNLYETPYDEAELTKTLMEFYEKMVE